MPRDSKGFLDTRPSSARSAPTETGFGATKADIERGYLQADSPEKPSMEAENYKPWGTVDKDDPMPTWMPWDGEVDGSTEPETEYQFQNKNRRAKGLLTRPWYPTER